MKSDLQQILSQWKADLRLNDNRKAREEILDKLRADFAEVQKLVSLLMTQCLTLSRQVAHQEYLLSKQSIYPDIIDVQFIVNKDNSVTTRIWWDDGFITEVTNTERDLFDPIYGINLCYATRCAGSKNKLRKIYKKYARVAYDNQWRD